MPRYDYQCEAGHRYETTEPFGSPAQQACQKCGKPARRLLSAPSIVFKGSGWYSTDSQRTLRAGVGTERNSGESSDQSTGDSNESGSDAAPPKKSVARTKTSKATKTKAAPVDE